MALRWQYALSGTDCDGRKAIHTGLRHGAAHAGEPVGGAERRKSGGDAHPSLSLSLGSYSGDSVFFAAVRGEQRISFLQLPVKISGARQLETSLRSADGVALFSGGHVGDERQAEVQGSGRRRIGPGWRE